ncbi:methyl-accepting chemotaxis protein [Anaeromyxobacter terrae]|uniref:methyl-accepting chemotaxis protein n=1 Tax=Anaeromyxobacter terrae TaxID=2925406 RepID=UPI001F59EDC0|nr:methyl-accepting chemotaxis protein [Anaeromyxobacter sp. SG22]
MKRLGYDWYGALIGVGLPVVATFVEAYRHLGTLTPDALLRTHLHQPLLWLMDTTPFVLGAIGKLVERQHDELVRQSAEILRQSDEIVRLEQARRESFDRTAKELSLVAQGLLGNVAAFTRTTSEAAAGVRETTAAMNQLSLSASSAALTAETVIGLAVQAERQSAQGLAQAEASGAELLRLAEEVRGLSRQIEALDARMRDVYDLGDLLRDVADRSEQLAEGAAGIAARAGSGTEGPGDVAERLRRQGAETRSAAAHARQTLSDVHRAMLDAVSAAEGGIAHAQLGAATATRTAETIRGLATALSESSRAAREIARVAQQQEGAIEQVLKAMNEIAHSTDDTLASTREVDREARALNELATFLRAATKA